MSEETAKIVSEEKVSDHEDAPSNEEAENGPKDTTSKKKKKKNRNKGELIGNFEISANIRCTLCKVKLPVKLKCRLCYEHYI